MGVIKTGQKKILGFNFGENESLDRWKEILRSLKQRGVNNVSLFITDGLSGMPTAIQEIYHNTSPKMYCAAYSNKAEISTN